MYITDYNCYYFRSIVFWTGEECARFDLSQFSHVSKTCETFWGQYGFVLQYRVCLRGREKKKALKHKLPIYELVAMIWYLAMRRVTLSACLFLMSSCHPYRTLVLHRVMVCQIFVRHQQGEFVPKSFKYSLGVKQVTLTVPSPKRLNLVSKMWWVTLCWKAINLESLVIWKGNEYTLIPFILYHGLILLFHQNRNKNWNKSTCFKPPLPKTFHQQE